jgi:hypothetical protein
MGRMYVASVLMSISDTQPAEIAEVELQPTTPGAWAAWARTPDARQEVPAVSREDAAVAGPAAQPLEPAAGQA